MHVLGFSLQTWVSNMKQNEKSTSSTLEISKLHVRSVARSTDTSQLCSSSGSSLKGGVNLAPSHPLPTQDLCSPHLLPHGGTFVYVGADLIAMSFFKGLFCLVVDIVSVVTSGWAQSSASHLGPLFIATSSSTEAAPKEGLCRLWWPIFPNTWLCFRRHTAECAVLESWFQGLGFLFPVYCESLQCYSSLVTLLLAGNSPLSHFRLCEIHSNTQTLVSEQGGPSGR